MRAEINPLYAGEDFERNPDCWRYKDCKLVESKWLPLPYCQVHLHSVARCKNCKKRFHTDRAHTGTCGTKCRKALSRKSSSSKV